MAAPIFQIHPPAGPPAEDVPAEVLPSPTAPYDVASVLLQEQRKEDGVLRLRRWRGEWWRYAGPHWVESEPEAVRRWLYHRLNGAKYLAKDAKGNDDLRPWAPDKGKLDRLLDAMTADTLLERDTDAPVWLDEDGKPGASARGILACTNGLVDVGTQTLRDATPAWFGINSVPFAFDPEAEAPRAWLEFLRVLWPQVEDTERPGTLRDADEVLTLQEWFGYVLSGRLDLQKILLIVGPPRSGKGTIAGILEALLGAANVAAPTLSSLGTQFGLQPLLGKMLAVVGDARLPGQGQEAVVERLLSISGQDSIGVDRKNREAWIGRIPARFMILSNELPRFGDASGAISSRMVILTLQESFLGREDTGLAARLHAELPAILKWSLDGVARLNRRGRLTEPAASRDAVQVLADLVSPISAFVREVCVKDPAESVEIGRLYREYAAWCEENGRGKGSAQKMSSDLRSILPGLTDYRPKVNGKAMPRAYRGLGLNPEWTGRIKAAEDWRIGQDPGPEDPGPEDHPPF
jgi:putative DNA primase/helicase